MADQMTLYGEVGGRKQGGKATTDVTLSAHVGGNAEIFPQILDLHLFPGALIADVTWGKCQGHRIKSS